MPKQWRLNLALILTLGSGAVLVRLTQNRSIGDVLPLVIGALVMIAGVQYVLIFRGQARTQHPELRTAQAEYLQGKFQAVVDRLEEATAYELPNDVLVSMLTLQGNAYRQLGQLDLSEGTLQDAVQMDESNHYPLYGLGRTLLVSGEYAEAEGYLRQALVNGAKKSTRADHVLAQYYAGFDSDAMLEAALQASRVLRMEPHRTLMVNYVLYRLYSAQKPANEAQMQLAQNIMQNTAAGLTFWTAEAERFSHTPYGQRLAKDVQRIREIIGSEQDI